MSDKYPVPGDGAPGLLNLPPKQLSLLSSVIGLAMIDGLTASQQNVIGNFLVNVGTNILTAAAQAQYLSEIAQANATDDKSGS